MRARNFLTFAITFALPAAVIAQGGGEANAKTGPKTAASRLVVMPANDLKWTDLGPGAPGVKVADCGATMRRAHSGRSSSCRRDSQLLSTLTPTT